MKVKLLKKLHKRFKWRYDKDAHGNPWRVYDKELRCEIYPELPWRLGYWYSERTIYALMKELCLEVFFTTIRYRKEKRIKERLLQKQRLEWEA